MCGAEVALWEETVGFLCWGQPWPASCGSFNILQFKYGVLESGLFSEFFKEEGASDEIAVALSKLSPKQKALLLAFLENL